MRNVFEIECVFFKKDSSGRWCGLWGCEREENHISLGSCLMVLSGPKYFYTRKVSDCAGDLPLKKRDANKKLFFHFLL